MNRLLIKLYNIFPFKYSLFLVAFLLFINISFAQNKFDTSINTIKALKEIYPDSALKILRYKLELLKNNEQQYFSNLLLMANQLASINKNDSAIKLYLQCDGYFAKHSDSFSLYSINAGLGKVYDNLNDYNTEKKYQFRALNFCNGNQFPKNKLTQYTNIASLYAQYYQFDSVLFFYKKARNYLPLLNEKDFIEYSNFLEFVEAYPLAYSKKFQQSNNNLKKALSYYRLTNKINALYCYQLFAYNYNKLKQYNNTIVYVDSALGIANELKLHNEILKIKDLKYQADSGAGNWYQAQKTLREINLLKDSIFNVENLKSKDELITKYQAEKKELQNIQLANEKQTLANYIKIILVFFLVLIILFYFIVKQSKKIKEFALVRENIISIISHDLRSPLLALQDLNTLASHYIKKNDFYKFNKVATDIDMASSNISTLSDNLLVWVKSQHKNYQQELKKIKNAKQIIDNTIKLYQPILQAKSIEINVNEMQESQQLLANDFVLNLIVRNWLDNVVKHANPTNINVLLQNKIPQISIVDDGILDNETIHYINTQLQQPNNMYAENKGSLGLSLMAYYANKVNYKIVVKKENSQNLFYISW